MAGRASLPWQPPKPILSPAAAPRVPAGDPQLYLPSRRRFCPSLYGGFQVTLEKRLQVPRLSLKCSISTGLQQRKTLPRLSGASGRNELLRATGLCTG